MESDEEKIQELIVMYELVINNMKTTAHQFLQEFKEIWDKSGNNLSSIVPGPNNLMTYLIHCSHVMEISSLLFFIENEQAEKDNIKTFLIDLINKEPGCARIPSDFYGISLVLPILVLNSTGNRDIALKLIRDATIWLCDRYQKGIGLADISADPNEETEILCGYAFDFIKVHKRTGSFVAAIISDLAAFLSDGVLYSNIINDIKASNIFPQYWQVPDNQSLFTQDGEDIIQYPNIEYIDDLLPFDGFSFAEHIKHEVRSFSITEKTGPLGLFMLMLLLRDRYFPTIWPSVTK
jgi:hypothetical protein